MCQSHGWMQYARSSIVSQVDNCLFSNIIQLSNDDCMDVQMQLVASSGPTLHDAWCGRVSRDLTLSDGRYNAVQNRQDAHVPANSRTDTESCEGTLASTARKLTLGAEKRSVSRSPLLYSLQHPSTSASPLSSPVFLNSPQSPRNTSQYIGELNLNLQK